MMNTFFFMTRNNRWAVAFPGEGSQIFRSFEAAFEYYLERSKKG